ncbi:TolC family protein [Herbaspirillum sp. RTI4]|uniref:TolC family protein n=1 Tax=Herbaspirillum sp. RTI4 TaxID=3048640 RepID=UPI002AB3327C|nr:TolC family protein [Herbaspirillum sp. RTI4]MDY7579886.1 TolC family protein [Herbaspirillum sp. RTI4]MEA9983487.1 TolC family protein [Herbaspirillum sp. RTI4]
MAATPAQAGALQLSPASIRMEQDAETIFVTSDRQPLRFIAQAVQAALNRSPDIEQAAASQRAAQQELDNARWNRWPKLQAQAGSGAYRLGGQSQRRDTSKPNLGLSVSTTVFDWGRTGHDIDSREHTMFAAGENLRHNQERTALLTTVALIQMGKHRQLSAVADAYAARMSELVNMLSDIVAVDRGRASELVQARAKLLQALTERDTVAAQSIEWEIKLRQLTGAAAAEVPLQEHWPLSPPPIADTLSWMAGSPQVMQAVQEEQAARAQAHAQRAAAWPQLNWVVGKQYENDAYGQRTPWQTQLTLTYTLQGGSSLAAAAAAVERSAAAAAHKERVLLDLEIQVRTAHAKAVASLARVADYVQMGAQTDQVRRMYFEQWHHLGRRSLLEVLTAESEHHHALTSSVHSRFEAYLAIIDMHAGAGRLLSWIASLESDGSVMQARGKGRLPH